MDDAPLETATSTSQVSTPDTPKTGLVQRILRPLILVVLVGAAFGGYYLYEEGQRHPSTDDAYVQANVVQIAPMVSGIVSRVHVVNNQHVEDGVPLFDLDTAPFVIAVEA